MSAGLSAAAEVDDTATRMAGQVLELIALTAEAQGYRAAPSTPMPVAVLASAANELGTNLWGRNKLLIFIANKLHDLAAALVTFPRDIAAGETEFALAKAVQLEAEDGSRYARGVLVELKRGERHPLIPVPGFS